MLLFQIAKLHTIMLLLFFSKGKKKREKKKKKIENRYKIIYVLYTDADHDLEIQ